MTTRYDIERALEQSDLPPVSRHIVLVLCSRMQMGSTLILPQHSPSLNRLARGTGWHRRTIMRHLALLEEEKWIERHRPAAELARSAYVTTRYVVRDPPALGAGSPALEAPGLVLGAGSPALGARRPANQISTDRESDQEIEFVIAELAKRTGRTITAAWAGKVRDQLVARPGIRSRLGYLKRVLSTDPHPERFLPSQEDEPFCERCGQTGHPKDDCPH